MNWYVDKYVGGQELHSYLCCTYTNCKQVVSTQHQLVKVCLGNVCSLSSISLVNTQGVGQTACNSIPILLLAPHWLHCTCMCVCLLVCGPLIINSNWVDLNISQRSNVHAHLQCQHEETRRLKFKHTTWQLLLAMQLRTMTDKVGCAQTEENYYALVTSGKGHAETINTHERQRFSSWF